MLLGVVNKKNIDQFDILYFEFPITLAEHPSVVFTDASANGMQAPNFYDDSALVSGLDWVAIDRLQWGNVDDAQRRRRMAEVLVHQQLPLMAASRCVVWNESVKARVEAAVMGTGFPFPTIAFEHSDRRHWYTNFQEGTKRSIVAGPAEVRNGFERACQEVTAGAGGNVALAAFADLETLRNALRANFGCLPQTAELVGLESDNRMHHNTVDGHTLDVVARLLALPVFAALSPVDQMLTELAAYLHDIGKGPRARWTSNNGRQKVDPNHPLGAMPMMVDILTRQVGTIQLDSARRLLKLVCYHDLIGEVLGKGRDERQIVAIAETCDDLDMLFAIGQADATSLNEFWWPADAVAALYERCASAI